MVNQSFNRRHGETSWGCTDLVVRVTNRMEQIWQCYNIKLYDAHSNTSPTPTSLHILLCKNITNAWSLILALTEEYSPHVMGVVYKYHMVLKCVHFIL